MAALPIGSNSAMDRVSGLYKRDLKYISIGVGIFIAALLNADSISVTQALWQDPKLRDAMVLAAENQLKNRGAQAQHQATVEPGPDQNENADQKNNVDPFKDLRETYDNANATLKPLPIGWDSTMLSKPLLSWPLRLFGWLMTGLAVSLGAPFWFDLLSKFMNIRGAGDKPTRASDA